MDTEDTYGLLLEFPFRIRFENEKVVDTGESVATCFLLSGKRRILRENSVYKPKYFYGCF